MPEHPPRHASGDGAPLCAPHLPAPAGHDADPLRAAVARLIEALPAALRRVDEPLWGRKAAAEYLQVSLRHLDALSASGAVPSLRLGRAVRYRPHDLRALVGPPSPRLEVGDNHE